MSDENNRDPRALYAQALALNGSRGDRNVMLPLIEQHFQQFSNHPESPVKDFSTVLEAEIKHRLAGGDPNAEMIIRSVRAELDNGTCGNRELQGQFGAYCAYEAREQAANKQRMKPFKYGLGDYATHHAGLRTGAKAWLRDKLSAGTSDLFR